MMHNIKEMKTEVEEVVLIKGEEKNKGKQSIDIRGAKMRTPKQRIKRPTQYLYPL